MRLPPLTASVTAVTTEEHAPAAQGERPALVALDDARLLLLYAEGSAVSDAGADSAQRLRIAVVDVDQGNILSTSPFVPATPPYDTDLGLRQARPAAARVGERIFIAWESESSAGEGFGSEAWIAEIAWSPDDPGTVRIVDERPVPVTASRTGDQRAPALASSPLFPEGALLTTWEGHGEGGRAGPSLRMGFRPVPFVSLGNAADGGTAPGR